MPSISARVVGFFLRTTGMYRRMYSGGPGFGASIRKVRAARLAEPRAGKKQQIEVTSEQVQGRTVWTLAPAGRPPTTYILYWHGGGYVYPPTPAHWSFLAEMVDRHGWHVTAPCYPLAPEAETKATTDFALDVYRDYAARLGPVPFFMGGDSAGAGLAAATAQQARDAKLPSAKGLLLICPWLNVVPDHPDQRSIEPRDAILTISGIAEAGQLYARSVGVSDPRASPIHGDWAGLPPILAFGGGDDILATDARALKSKLPSVDYHEAEGMIHDWPLFPFPESKKAQARMAEFVRQIVA